MYNSAIVMDSAVAVGLLDRPFTSTDKSIGQISRVPRFPDTLSAKDFLIGRIEAESLRINMPLSPAEAKMLCYSETYRSQPDMVAIKEAFERECNDTEYENKIAFLIRSYAAWVSKENPADLRQWASALYTLRKEDHYLLVLIGVAEGAFTAGNQPAPAKPLGRIARLILVGALLGAVALLLTYVVPHLTAHRW